MDHMDASAASFPTQPPEQLPASAQPTPSTAYTQPAASNPASACPSCGSSLGGAALYCPTCGRPVSAPNAAPSFLLARTPTPIGSGAYPAYPNYSGSDAPTVAGLTAPFAAPDEAAWPGQYPPAPTGMAALGSGAAVAPTPLARPHRLRSALAVVAALCIVALLASGAYALYAAFVDSSQAAARVLPDTTFVYASVDLTAAANNGHHITVNDLAQVVGFNAFVRAERLDWTQDISPWVGRTIAVAAFPVAGQSAAPANVSALGANSAALGGALASALNVGAAALLQSRSDSAALAAMAKSAHAQGQAGATIKQSTYGGFTLYTVSPTGGNALVGQTLTAGKGWAVIASSLGAAQLVVDRLNGQGTTLASAPAFQDATNALPSSRFGSVYINLREYYNTLLAMAPAGTQAAFDLPLVDTYPAAGGYLTWTTSGLRAQMTFTAVKGANIGAVSGDTTSLAALTPANATTYIGGANLGGLIHAYLAQIPALAQGATSDPLESAFGVSSSDTALQQPFAQISFPVGKTTASAYLLHAPNAAAVQSILKTVAKKSGWTLTPTTVDGVAATSITATTTSYTVTGTVTGSAKPPATPTKVVAGTQTIQVGVSAQIGQTFVLVHSVSTTAALAAIIGASQSVGASLSGSVTFQSLLTQAPSNAALTVYTNVAAARALAGGKPAQGLSAQVSAVLMTLVWNAQVNQTTLDIKLS